MDRHTLALFIPIIALSIPVVAILVNGLTKIARYRALGAAADGGTDVAARLDLLEQEVGGLRQEIADTQERLDFAERLLARPDAEQPRKLP